MLKRRLGLALVLGGIAAGAFASEARPGRLWSSNNFTSEYNPNHLPRWLQNLKKLTIEESGGGPKLASVILRLENRPRMSPGGTDDVRSAVCLREIMDMRPQNDRVLTARTPKLFFGWRVEVEYPRHSGDGSSDPHGVMRWRNLNPRYPWIRWLLRMKTPEIRVEIGELRQLPCYNEEAGVPPKDSMR